MADRRRPHRAAAAGLIAACVLAAVACGEAGSPSAGDGPLTVEEALRADGDGPLRVRGTLFAASSDVRLCQAILESHPPQCGEPSLRVRGLDLVGVSNMEQAKGVGWTGRDVTLVGEIRDGVLTVTTPG